MYLHVVERRPDGIVVRGAKAHQTGFSNSHEVIVMPTIAMGPDDKDYAVAFACPTDAEGIFLIVGRQSCDTTLSLAEQKLLLFLIMFSFLMIVSF